MATATDPAAPAPERRTGAPHATGASPDGVAASAGRGAEHIAGAFAQVREIAGFYVQTRLDRARVAAAAAIRTAILYAAIAVVALGIILAASFFLIAGAVQALAVAIRTPGVAALIVGGVLLGLVVGGAWFVGWRMHATQRRRLVDKYRGHHARQRATLGADVAELAGRPQESLARDAYDAKAKA